MTEELHVAGWGVGDHVLGRYRLLRNLGRTHWVYEAEDEVTGDRVVLKTPSARDLRHPQARERFVREAKNLLRAQGPGVVRMRNFAFMNPTCPVLVMDRLEGETLAERIERGPVPVDEAIAIIGALLRTLRRLHASGLLHRDLKPANILLTSSGPVLIDFGVSRSMQDARITQAGRLVGTPWYMAPDHLMGVSADASVDLYALSAVLFELVEGRPPFDLHYAQEPIGALLRRICRQEAPKSSSPALGDVIARGLQKRRSARYTSASQMLEALNAHRDHGRVSAHRSAFLSLRARPPIARPGLVRSRASLVEQAVA